MERLMKFGYSAINIPYIRCNARIISRGISNRFVSKVI